MELLKSVRIFHMCNAYSPSPIDKKKKKQEKEQRVILAYFQRACLTHQMLSRPPSFCLAWVDFSGPSARKPDQPPSTIYLSLPQLYMCGLGEGLTRMLISTLPPLLFTPLYLQSAWAHKPINFFCFFPSTLPLSHLTRVGLR